MADEIVRGVVSLTVEGVNVVREAATELDRFSSLSERAAQKQQQALRGLSTTAETTAQAVDRATASLERLARAQAAAGINAVGGSPRLNFANERSALAARQQQENDLKYQALHDARQQFLAKKRLTDLADTIRQEQALLQQQAQIQQQFGALAAQRTQAQAVQRNQQLTSSFAQTQNLVQQQRAFINSLGGGGAGITGPGGTGIPPGGFGPQGPQGYGGGFYNRASGYGQQFQQGFRGLRDRPYAEQLGQTFKFATFYGAAYGILFQLGNAFANAADEAVKFQDAINSLNIVTGKSTDQNRELADSLGEIASKAGVSPSEGVAAGARAIGLFGLSDAPQSTQDAAARTATRVATQIALGSGRTFEQIQADLGAVAQAFDTGYQGQSRIADLDAYITRRYGVTVGNTLETSAQIGTIAQEQGFSLAQQTAIAASLQARTGQSPAAVAGFLSQIYGKGTDPRLQAEFQSLGIGPEGNLKDQLDQLSQLNLTADQLNGVADKISKGKAGSAFRALVQDFQRILQTAEEADAGGAGASEQQFQQRLQNTAGQLRQFAGAVAEFGKDLLSTGILDIFGGLIVVFREILQALDPLLDLFNSLPEPIRLATLALAGLALTTKLLGGTNATIGRLAAAGPNNLLATAGAQNAAVASSVATRGLQFIPYAASTSLAGGLTQAQANSLAAASAQTRYGIINPALTAQPITGIANAQARGTLGGRTPLGLAATGLRAELAATLFNPITLAIGGLVALGAIKGKADELATAMEDAVPALQAVTDARTAAEYRNAGNAARNAAERVGEGRSGIDGFFAANLFNPESLTQEKRLRREAEFSDLAANAIETETKRAAALRQVSVFGDAATRTIDTITDALKALEATGVSAADRIKLLYRALLPGTEDTKTPVNRANVATDLTKRILGGAEGFGPRVPLGNTTRSVLAPGVLESLFGAKQGDIFKAIEESLPKTATGGILDQTEVQRVALAAANALGVDFPQIQGVKVKLRQLIVEYLTGKNFGASSNATLSTQDVLDQYGQALRPALDQQVAVIENTGNDPKAKIKAYRTFVKNTETILARRAQDGGDIGGLLDDFNAVKVKLSEAVVEQLEAVRRKAQGKADSKGEIKRIGQGALNKEIRALGAAGNVAGLIDVLEAANRGMIGIVRAEVRAEVRTARAASILARQRLAVVRTLQGIGSYVIGAALQDVAEADKKLADLEKVLGSLNKALGSADVPGKGGRYAKGDDSSSPLAAADSGPSETKAQIAAARAQAYATRRGGGIAEATAGLKSAKADMDAAKKGTVEFYSALGAYFAAQNSLRDALRDYQTNQQLLSGDISDPIFQAQVKLDAARKKLRQDRARGAGRDVIAQDRLDVRQAQLDAESVKFNERLQAAQTAERLGRISHAAYIRYLENESRRLNAIKNRTYQQQQQLDQVDLALKDAKEAFAGQFNIGDIKLPTPYEVRRYIKAQADGLTYQGGQAAPVSQTTIQIDGTDVGMVIRVLSEYLGPAAAGRTGTTASKKG
jgi:hypothetical protein